MNKKLIALAIAAVLAGCSQYTTEKELVSVKMKDPESAVFTDVKGGSGLVCGLVNGKNGFGAYGGNEPFYVLEGKVHLGELPPIAKLNELKVSHEELVETVRKYHSSPEAKAGWDKAIAEYKDQSLTIYNYKIKKSIENHDEALEEESKSIERLAELKVQIEEVTKLTTLADKIGCNKGVK